ncbi:hypothetical protein SPFL3102_00804 [Sporomusaceae bacterium FL31]|nr:hypothetical protein SPFL3101_00646 [Sporomusaceae bacterium FL31]GCE33003.1 hypothetical protein SPFL3102_00804 [Sporomusaceae bacterium]
MKHHIDLTSPEIAALWKNYLQSTAVLCFLRHSNQYIQDEEIKPLLNEQIQALTDNIGKTAKIFTDENFPIPQGFSDVDVNLDAPPLYTDLYALSFVYRYNQMGLADYAATLTKVARQDIVTFFHQILESTTQIYLKALDMMLSKGIYDRPPKISYPVQAEFIKKQDSFIDALLGNTRPLNVFELGEVFSTIERNYIGLLLLLGFIQVVKDKEIKKYLVKGKKLAEQQIETFNKILKDEEEIGNIPVSMEVTSSIISPYSDRLMMFLIATTAATGFYLVTYSLSVSMRKDLVTKFALFVPKIMLYGNKGITIMIQRGWMEQPPQAVDRKALCQV